MDKGTVFGFILGVGFIVFAIVLSGLDNVFLFWNISAVLIVFGGAISAVLIAFPLKTVLKSPTYLRKSFIHEENNPQAIIEQIVTLSETARRQGLLALENHLEEIENPFLAEGIQMVVDGLPTESVEKILNSEINAMNVRHKQGRSLIANYGRFTPAFGMIGTLVGLILMFAHLDPETIGTGMAVAILTTLYGAVVSYLLFLPIAEKLATLNDSELQMREMMLQGVIALQTGEHPRVIRLKLQTYLAPEERPKDIYLAPNSMIEEETEEMLTEEKIAA
ncbi:MAG: MotA/TolQ/ExbB proton channel family protein [Planctomycetaceae bacterium]|jgi:chemotaxis protein MotA|nr:MotA/TolQ/ExbB proton channel family protein [Planctomycetaceae bacterium]